MSKQDKRAHNKSGFVERVENNMFLRKHFKARNVRYNGGKINTPSIVGWRLTSVLSGKHPNTRQNIRQVRSDKKIRYYLSGRVLIVRFIPIQDRLLCPWGGNTDIYLGRLCRVRTILQLKSKLQQL